MRIKIPVLCLNWECPPDSRSPESRHITFDSLAASGPVDTVPGLRAFLDSSGDQIYAVDRQWRIAYLNRRAAERFADRLGKPDSILGGNIWEMFPHLGGTEFERQLRLASATAAPGEFDTELLGYWYHVRVQPFDNGLVINYRDVTAQKQLEEQLRQAQKMEAIGKLAGGVAHDFNNLLTVINGYARRIVDALRQEDPLREEAATLLRAGESAADLTRQLLAFSRRQVLQPRHIDIRASITGMEPILRRLVPTAIEIRTVLASEPCVALADQTQFEQVIMNLVVNAVDAMPRGGILTIEASRTLLDEAYASEHAGVTSGHYVQFAVTDTGVGMDTHTRERIFEPFFTTKEQGHGTGLGLSTVYGIVKQSGGHIWVYSELGQGTTFKVHLPLSHHEATQRTAGSRTPNNLRGTETVYLVEDDKRVREFIAQTLSGLGYRVLQSQSPLEALAELNRSPEEIHLLITDVVMPKMSGRELAQALIPSRPATRVLYCSGYSDDVIVTNGILDPGLDFLSKPFSAHALAVKVRQILSGPQRRRSVVVVDDDAPVRHLVRKTLEDAGYSVLVGANGRDALELCEEGPVDLLLTDLVMPERDGIETIRFFHKERPHIPVIAMSGGMPDLLGAASILGARDVIEKPIDPQSLVAMVRKLIG